MRVGQQLFQRKEQEDDAVIFVNRYAASTPQTGTPEDLYKGLRIHALTGLHEFLGKIAAGSFAPAGDVLDLAAGTGAMSLRLHDLGFKVTAADILPGSFALHGVVPFVQANLNDEFSGKMGRTFDAIMALEIIEHLENPRKFLRQCFKLLKPGGMMLLSTPNADSPVSRAMMIRFGTFQWFTDEDYSSYGHITPVTQWQLAKMAEESGFQEIRKSSFGAPFRGTKGWFKMALLAWMVSRLSTLDSVLNGEIFVSLLKRPAL